jgi:formylmethanofuran dehydrogenase subunit A
MSVLLRNATCIDGVQPSTVRDLALDGDCIQDLSSTAKPAAATYDLKDCIVVAGGIDLHTHIGGGKLNVARLMLPELVNHVPSHEERIARQPESIQASIAPLSSPVPGTLETGKRYLQMGYTACFEPAVLPANARHTRKWPTRRG